MTRAPAIVVVTVVVVAVGCGDDEGSSSKPATEAAPASTSEKAASPTGARGLDKLVTDPRQRLRPVVRGKFEYASAKANFTQRFIGRFPAPNCDAYGRKGEGGKFSTPYILYPKGTRLSPSMNAGVTIKNYGGPGNYDNSGPALTGSIGARDADGSSLSQLSAVNFSEVKFTAAKDAGGRIYFSGDDLQNRGANDDVSGQIYWTCSDERIDTDAYETNPY